mmetsp:Transcript_37613/g.118797  ORF Transcript_37613/g.118797 Transcript_37613/m.118797 type:complete len:221 (+) Transcript_37613:1387-2049(+)
MLRDFGVDGPQGAVLSPVSVPYSAVGSPGVSHLDEPEAVVRDRLHVEDGVPVVHQQPAGALGLRLSVSNGQGAREEVTLALRLLQLPPQASCLDSLQPLPPLGVDGLRHSSRQVCQRLAYLPRLDRRVGAVQLRVGFLQQLDPYLGRGHAAAEGRDETSAAGVDDTRDASVYSHVVPGAVLVQLDGDDASVEQVGVGHVGVHLLQGPEDLLHHVGPAGDD